MSLKPPVSDQDHIQGNKDAIIELVEYGDYQCPYCGDFYYVVKALQQHFGDNLKFVFRNFPLEMHPDALHAAIASEIAAKYDQFWSMHDKLYEHQNALSDTHLIAYAQQLGIDKQDFESDFSHKQITSKIDSDIESGLRSGVNGTPSVYINGQKYDGDYEFDALRDYLTKLL